MMGFVTLSSMFVANMVLLIVLIASGELALAILPATGALITGCAITRIVVVPEVRRNAFLED